MRKVFGHILVRSVSNGWGLRECVLIAEDGGGHRRINWVIMRCCYSNGWGLRECGFIAEGWIGAVGVGMVEDAKGSGPSW